MKYLKKFFESEWIGLFGKATQLSDEEYETIENCFLNYIDDQRCTAQQLDYAAIFEFGAPMKWTASIRNFRISSPTLRKWAEDLKKELQGDINRLKTYGFNCAFNDNDLYINGNLILIVIREKFNI